MKKALVTLAATLAILSTSGWTAAEAAQARITDFIFGCTVPDGSRHKPKFGNVDGGFWTDIPAQREECEAAIKRKIVECRANTGFMTNTKEREYAGCLPIFRRQAELCVDHFERQEYKCTSGGTGGTAGRAPAGTDMVRAVEEPEEEAAADVGPGWIVAENQPCQVFDAYGLAGLTVEWTGACLAGKASGPGRSVWRWAGGKEAVVSGEFRDGKIHGHTRVIPIPPADASRATRASIATARSTATGS